MICGEANAVSASCGLACESDAVDGHRQCCPYWSTHDQC